MSDLLDNNTLNSSNSSNNILCAPALIYLIFSFSQIIIDIFKKMYNTALVKFIIMILFTVLLNMLCQMELSIVSWIIIIIPFIFMSVITTILLFVFGLDPKNGKLKIKNVTKDYKQSYKSKKNKKKKKYYSDEYYSKKEPLNPVKRYNKYKHPRPYKYRYNHYNKYNNYNHYNKTNYRYSHNDYYRNRLY